LSLIRDKAFRAVAAAHLVVDLINGQKSVLLAFLSVPLGLSNSALGLVNTLYTLMASLSQPLFGSLADRYGTRWVATLGVMWLIAFFAAAMVVPGYGSLVLLVVAALGSAVFHPAGVMEATLRGQEAFAGRETTSASLFFLFGQSGLALGPALGGPLLEKWGPPGLLLLLVIAIPTGANAALAVTPGRRTAPAKSSPGSGHSGRLNLPAIVAFGGLAVIRMWVQFNFIVFLPKYYADLGYDPTIYGLIAALFMAGVAAANVAGGWLGDRIPRWPIVVSTLTASALPIALFPWLGPTPWAYVLAPISGALIGASHSLIVVHAQRLMPDKMGTASGMVLGMTFAAGSIGTLVSGAQADHFGFSAMFLTTAALALVGGVLGLTMRARPWAPQAETLG
jgi:FSR family fosmidomycin resistance protein-like MFS transporter